MTAFHDGGTATVPAGAWVEIEQTVLAAEDRAPTLPEDTARTPYLLRVAGFLTGPASLGMTVTVRSLIGRTHEGVLRTGNPSYTHSFGDTVPELLTIGPTADRAAQPGASAADRAAAQQGDRAAQPGASAADRAAAQQGDRAAQPGASAADRAADRVERA